MKPKQIQSKNRRLNREINFLEQLVRDTEKSILHNPYKQDLPGLKKQLGDARFDLAEAVEEDLNTEVAPILTSDTMAGWKL